MKRLATLAILLDDAACKRRWQFGLNVFERILMEMLEHVGIAYTVMGSARQVRERRPDLLLVAAAPEDKDTAESLLDYVQSGGLLISYGGLNCVARKLGYRKGKECHTGYADLSAFCGTPEPLRWLSATTWTNEGDLPAAPCGVLTGEEGRLARDCPQGADLGPALQRFSVGAGAIDRWAVNIPYTVAVLQQGSKPVLEDGDPAPDGSAQVNEGILKTDDVMELDWQWDRQTTPGTPYPFFQIPYADLWKEALVRHLLERVLSLGLTLPFVDYWPDGVSQVALISLDSDHNINDEAWTTLELLREIRVPTTWCMVEPGYEPAVYERVKADGHELALHFNAVLSEGQEWSEACFDRQFQWLKEATGESSFVSNKNHVTREEGWGDLFRWCEVHGIASDQSRGPSKKGNGGFAFGTCHPYFPLAWANEKNRSYDVLQVGFLLSDFNHMGTDTHIPILKQVKRVRGVAHVVLHQTHLHTKEIDRNWLRAIVSEARALDYAFWTGEQINDWERARRKLRITAVGDDGAVGWLGHAPAGAVALVPIPAEAAGYEREDIVVRFGVNCIKTVLSAKGAESQ